MTKRQISGSVPKACDLGSNLLLKLRPEDYAQIQKMLEGWTGEKGDVLYEPGQSVNYVYFPTGGAMVSYRVIMPDGRTVETAMIGREGAVGGIVSNGRLPAYARSVIQFQGAFYRLPLAELDRLKAENAAIRHLFARYADCLLAQIFQGTACNAAHSIEQRAAKWMVSALAHTENDNLTLTQEQLGGLLGVGRSYVARVLARFREKGLLSTRRGHLVICDVPGIERASCKCDQSVRYHFEEVLAGVYPEAPSTK